VDKKKSLMTVGTFGIFPEWVGGADKEVRREKGTSILQMKVKTSISEKDRKGKREEKRGVSFTSAAISPQGSKKELQNLAGERGIVNSEK